MKKTYYYDYKQALPTNTSGEIKIQSNDARDQEKQTYSLDTNPNPNPPTQTPNQTFPQDQPQDVNLQKSSPPPQRDDQYPRTPPPSPRTYQNQRAPIQKSNFIPIVLTTIFLLIAGTIIYSRLPGNYDECAKWPGSKISENTPSSCTTFYGRKFTKSTLAADTELPPFEGTTFTPTPQSGTTAGTNTSTDTSGPTTKGGLPLNPTPTPKSNSTQVSPTVTVTATVPDKNATNIPADWLTHRYPQQHLSLELPSNWTSTNVTRNRDTNISTFTISASGAKAITATIQPNWDNTDDAKNQSIAFMLDETGVIKQEKDNQTTYYFEKNGQVHIFQCVSNQDTCVQILKSIRFI